MDLDKCLYGIVLISITLIIILGACMRLTNKYDNTVIGDENMRKYTDYIVFLTSSSIIVGYGLYYVGKMVYRGVTCKVNYDAFKM